MPTPFANEPILELRRATVRSALADALARTDAQLPVKVPVMIGDDAREGAELISTDPGRPERTVGTSAVAGQADVEAAIAQARRGLAQWRAVSAADRAGAMVAAAVWLRERRLELAA